MNEIQTITNYYRKVAEVYDLNRHFFLFGRKRLIEKLSSQYSDLPRILEIGCGTGTILLELSRNYPNSEIVGLDLSENMLTVARQKTADIPNITLIQGKFDADFIDKPFDLVVFSYALSVFPDLESTLALTQKQLAPGGMIAMVDFFDSHYDLFRLWISRNIPIRTHFPIQTLHARFKEEYCKTHRAYFGFWKYFLFIGSVNV
ncbi:MAG: class I SAM-dependent methyltransferase [Candidatus Parabeggiatoa sp.]|nr:class I SAM-dependent methyltransferase [Candidatus Parabeggiatoa sp.]